MYTENRSPGIYQAPYLLEIPRLTISELVVLVFFFVFFFFERKVILVVIKGPRVDVVAPPSSTILLVRFHNAFALSHLHLPRRSTICKSTGYVCDGRRRGAGFVHEPARVGGEPLVDLLETFARRLDDEEVDDGDEAGVEDRVEQVEAPVQVVDADRRRLHDYVVEEPVAGRGECGAFGPHAQRVDLGRVEPRGGDPAEAKGEEIEGYEDGGYDAGDVVAVVVAEFGADGDAEEGDGHGDGHGHEEGPPAQAFDEEEGGGCGEHVEDCDAGGEDVRG